MFYELGWCEKNISKTKKDQIRYTVIESTATNAKVIQLEMRFYYYPRLPIK